MPLDRTWYTTLVDDNGTGTTGTVWDKAAIDAFINAIDALRLDQVAAPTDVTTLNATTSAHGLLPKLGGGTTNYLRADGTWATPSVGAPAAHASTHQPGGSDAMAVDAAAGTGSLRTLGTAGTSAAAGNDSRLSDARTPTAHATSHKSGGSDAVKLDELAVPTDVTTLNASTSAHGLLPKLSNVSTEYLNGQGSWATPAGGGGTSVGVAALCAGRLTLTSGVPVTIADVTGATSIYVTPFNGYEIGLYNDSTWNARTFTEIAVSLSGLAANSVFDLFAYDNAGAVAIEISAAWSTAAGARFSSGAYATVLPTQDGVPVKSTNGTAIDATRRYLGTFGTTGTTGQTEDSFAKRYLYNHYHQRRRGLQRLESSASWTYTSGTARQAAANAANQVEAVIGVQGPLLALTLMVVTANGSANHYGLVSIAEDSTSGHGTGQFHGPYTQSWPASNEQLHMVGLTKHPAIGRHYYAWIESGSAGGTTTWYSAPIGAGNSQSGMAGFIEG